MSDVIDNVRFVRAVRTPTSERYEIVSEGGDRVASLDLHFLSQQTGDVAHGSLVILQELEEEDEQELVSRINREITDSWAPELAREDFVLEVFQGRLISTYHDTDEFPEGYDEDDLEDEEF